MYEEYEKSMERLARILRRVKKGFLIALAVLIPTFLFCFGVGFRYRDLTCESVTYGELPKPSSGISAIGSTVYEYRTITFTQDAEDDGESSKKTEYSEWTETVPTMPGTYEVRAHSVSFLGVERDSDSVRFQIQKKKLTFKLNDVTVYGDPTEVAVSKDDYSVEGFVYGDHLGYCEIEYIDDYRDTSKRKYRLVSENGRFVVHADDSDARDCYTFPDTRGTIRDERVRITVTAGSKKIKYDGNPKISLEYDHAEITSGKLKDGHSAEFHTRMVQAAVGSLGTLSAVNEVIQEERCIFDKNGNDVTYQYLINYKDGSLEIEPRKITLTSGSASKEYDGTPLTNPEYTVSGEGLAEGDRLEAYCDGFQIEVGKSPNTFGSIRIISDTYGDVSEYYVVTEKNGILRVYAKQGGYNPGDGPGQGGNPGGNIESAEEGEFSLSGSGFGGMSMNPARVFSFYGQSYRTYYFREWNYGIYDGHTWYKTVGEDNYKPWSDYLTGEALQYYGGDRDSVSIRELALNHRVYPYHMTRDAIDGTDGKSYSCEAYLNPYGSWLPSSPDERESEYNAFVRENYLDISSELSAALLELGRKAGIREDSSNLIDDIARYIQGAAAYDLNFPAFPEDQDMVLYFLTVSKRGICQHYASAATMMYRAYGIPARFTVGFVQSGYPGRWTWVTTNCGHAWVEVYVDGTGWLPVEVTGGPDGSLSGGLISGGEISDIGFSDDPFLWVAYDSISKEYDGQTPGSIRLEAHLVSGMLRDGDSISAPVVVLGPDEQFVNAGQYLTETYLDIDVKVVDSSGRDVTDQYNLSVSPPEFDINQRELTLVIYADSQYDTNSLRWRIISGSLVNGHTLKVIHEEDKDWDHGVAVNIGSVGDHQVFAEVLDEDGFNVTDNYAFNYRYLSDSEWYQYYGDDDWD